MAGPIAKLKHAWNAFVDQSISDRMRSYGDYGLAYSSRPDRTRLHVTNERSIIA